MDYQFYTPQAFQYLKIHSIIVNTILLIILTAIFAAVNIFFNLPTLIFFAILALFIVVMAYSLFDSIYSYKICYQRHRYLITNSKIEVINHNIFYKTHELMPICRLQKVNVSAGPIEQHFDLASVSLISAGSTIVLPHVPSETAKQLSNQLKSRVNILFALEQGIKVEGEGDIDV